MKSAIERTTAKSYAAASIDEVSESFGKISYGYVFEYFHEPLYMQVTGCYAALQGDTLICLLAFLFFHLVMHRACG